MQVINLKLESNMKEEMLEAIYGTVERLEQKVDELSASPKKRVCHKSMTHPFSQKTPTCKLLSCSLRKFSVLFTTKPKLSQARALSFCKKVVSLQKTFIEYGKDTNKIRNKERFELFSFIF